MTDLAETASTRTTDTVIDEVRTWLEENWDPDLTVAEWWERLGSNGWSSPGLPSNAYGKDLSRADAVAVTTRQGPVWLPLAATVALADAAADATVFAQGREHGRHGRHAAALALYHVLASRFPQSAYAPAALLGKGQEADALARSGGSAAVARWPPSEASSAPWSFFRARSISRRRDRPRGSKM